MSDTTNNTENVNTTTVSNSTGNISITNQGDIAIDRDVLESQIRQIYADAMWNHRTQEEQANVYQRRYNFLEATKVVLSTVTTSGIAGTIFLQQDIIKYITAGVSLVTLLVTSYSKTVDLSALYKQYKDSSLQFLDIRDQLLNLLYSIKLQSVDIQEIMKERDTIFSQLRTVQNGANEVSASVKKLIEKNIKITEDNLYSDDQINNILPSILRLGSSGSSATTTTNASK